MASCRRNFNIVNLLLCLVVHSALTESTHITVYTEKEFKGENSRVNIANCSNLPHPLLRNISSVKTHEKCARLHDDYDCTGNYIELLPRQPAHNILSAWNFESRTVSVGPCPHPCRVQSSELPVQIRLYNQKYYKGLHLNINVKGCTPISLQYQKNWTMSVQTFGNCIQLYKTNECIDGPGVDTIELRPGTPAHDDLSAWHFPLLKAISRCDYKCRNKNSIIPNRTVNLYQRTKYRGNFYNFRVLDSHCNNLPANWEGLTTSIELGPNICIVLLDQRNCTGQRLILNSSVTNLGTLDFGGRVRSVVKCSPKWIIPISTTTTRTKTNTSIVTFLSTNTPVITHPSTNTPIVTYPFTNTPAITHPSTNITFSTIRSTLTSVAIPIFTDKTATKDNQDQNSSNSNNLFYPLFISVLVVVPLIAVVLSVVVMFCVLRHCNPYKKESPKLSEKEIREFLSGVGIDLLANGSTRSDNDYSTELLAQNNAYNQEYEIARSRIKIDSGALLGAGEFGMVYKGNLLRANDNENNDSSSSRNNIPVAIKMVNATSGVNGLRSLLKEVKVMLYMGQHTNIVHIIGCCTDKLAEGDIMVVMEYCTEGALESYLKKNRLSFNSLVNKGKLELRSSLSSKQDKMNSFDTFRIIQWCLEIARGMEFLSNAKIVHSDLAARNILLTDQLVAKISDFGLSRQLYAYSQYMKKHQEPLPFRWMAIESLKSLEFSTKSDVWSYGVLVWEAFSLAEKPYPGLGWNEAFISNLEGGLRLAKPKNSTNEFYNLMLRCWEEEPNQRPSFTDIITEIEDYFPGVKTLD